MPFVRPFQVTWGDLDANRHMRNTAYLDYATQARFLFLAEHGFPPASFAEHAVGPAVFEDAVQYRKELHHLQHFRVELWLAAQSEDGRHYAFENRFVRGEDDLCAVVRTRAAWFDLRSRKVCVPPPALAAAMSALDRTEGFTVL